MYRTAEKDEPQSLGRKWPRLPVLTPSQLVFCSNLCAENKQWSLITWRKVSAHCILAHLPPERSHLPEARWLLFSFLGFPSHFPVLLPKSLSSAGVHVTWAETKRMWAAARVGALLPGHEEAAGRAVCQVPTPLLHPCSPCLPQPAVIRHPAEPQLKE